MRMPMDTTEILYVRTEACDVLICTAGISRSA
jgi:hypothetical protein